MCFLSEWEEILLDDCPVYTTNVANPTSFPHGREGSHRLMGVDIFAREGLNRVTLLHDQAEKFFNAFEILEEEVFKVPIYLRRIDVNLQYQGQDGTSHCDGTNHDEYTVMVMNNKHRPYGRALKRRWEAKKAGAKDDGIYYVDRKPKNIYVYYLNKKVKKKYLYMSNQKVVL